MLSELYSNKIKPAHFAIREWNARRKSVRKHKRKLRNRKAYDYRLCVLGIFKNEAFNIREWVEHYEWQGADKIFLIDNGSTDNSMELLSDYVQRGLVEVISLPGLTGRCVTIGKHLESLKFPNIMNG